MATCHSRALGFHIIQHPKSLTLCWQSVDAVLILCWQSVDALLTLSLRCSSIDTHDITYKGCQYFDYGKCGITALGLYKMQHPKLLMLCWRSFSDWGWDHLAVSFAHQGCQYVDYRYQRANGIPMDILTRPTTVDAPLMLTFRMCLLTCRLLVRL